MMDEEFNQEVENLPRNPEKIRGRGSLDNPTGRFESLRRVEKVWETDFDDREEQSPPRTEFLIDSSKSILSKNDSPDVGFSVSINPYRGCEHGCAYCYARPTHEYLGFSAGLDFETKILIKENAPELLRKQLSSPSYVPETIGISGVTDPYQPIERRLKLTRRCLEILAEFRHPLVIITKNALVTRDADLLAELAKARAVLVILSVTTLDAELCGKLEPRTSRPAARLRAISELTKAGIPCGVNIAPVIPGLTDHELPSILEGAHRAGARQAGYTPIRLPYGVAPLFERWLDTHYADRKAKVLGRIRDLRGGKLNEPAFGSRMVGQGVFAQQMRSLFQVSCRRLGYEESAASLSKTSFRRSVQPGEQFSLFDG